MLRDAILNNTKNVFKNYERHVITRLVNSQLTEEQYNDYDITYIHLNAELMPADLQDVQTSPDI